MSSAYKILSGVSLRPLTYEDIGDIHALKDDAVGAALAGVEGEFVDEATFRASMAKSVTSDAKQATVFVVLFEGKMAGYIGGFPVIGGNWQISYWIARPYWKRHIGTNAVELFLKGRPVSMRGVVLFAAVIKGNVASIKILERFGFHAYRNRQFLSAAHGCYKEQILFRKPAIELSMKTEFKPIPDSDLDMYFDLLNDESLAMNAGTVPHPITREWAAERLTSRRGEEAAGTCADWGLYEDNSLIGSGGYFYKGHGLEIGYSVHRNHRGRGLATKLAKLVVKLARDHRRTGPVSANYFQDNPASGRVLEKTGFVRVGADTGTSSARSGDIPSFNTLLKGDVALSEIVETDYTPLFEAQNDEEAHYQAAGGSLFEDEAAFRAHVKKAVEAGAVFRTILLEGNVSGYIASFDRFGKREISYWIDRRFWGQGIASKAVALWLEDFPLPAEGLYARAAKDHPASARVLTKHGFTAIEDDTYFSDVRGKDVDETLYRLGA